MLSSASRSARKGTGRTEKRWNVETLTRVTIVLGRANQLAERRTGKAATRPQSRRREAETP
jgi:hypothetical protein